MLKYSIFCDTDLFNLQKPTITCSPIQVLNYWRTYKDLPPKTAELYNPEEYDLVPKKDIIEKRIKEKEEQIRRVESQKELESAGWDERIKQLQTDIDELKKKL